MMKNVLIIAVIFGFIYFKMFFGIFSKDELTNKNCHNMNNTLIEPSILHQEITGYHINQLVLSINGYIQDLKKTSALSNFQLSESVLQGCSITDIQSFKHGTVQNINRIHQAKQIQTSRKKNIEFQSEELRIIDIKKNPIEYNTYQGQEYWNYIYQKILPSTSDSEPLHDQTLRKLMSGAQSVMSMLVSMTIHDKVGSPMNLLQQYEVMFDKVGSSKDRVENMYLYYLLLVRQFKEQCIRINTMVAGEIGDETPQYTELFLKMINEIDKNSPWIQTINLQVEDGIESAFSPIAEVFKCIRDCTVCKLHGNVILKSIEAMIRTSQNKETNLLDLIYTINALFRAQDAMMKYQQFIDFEEDSNSSKSFVKLTYIVGLALSFIVSLFILDYYAKRQLQHDKELIEEEEEYQEKLKREREARINSKLGIGEGNASKAIKNKIFKED